MNTKLIEALQGCVDELELHERHARDAGDTDLLSRLDAARQALAESSGGSQYTVILLRPDYITDSYGHDTYHAHVTTTSETVAIEMAQREACEVDGNDNENYDDYHVLALFSGHLYSLR